MEKNKSFNLDDLKEAKETQEKLDNSADNLDHFNDNENQSSGISLLDLKNQREITENFEVQIEKETEDLKREVERISPEDRQKIDKIKDGINLLDSQASSQYGVEAQKELATFSGTILKNVRTKDAGDVGYMLTDLMDKVNELEIDSLNEKKGIFSNLPFKRKIENTVSRIMVRYEVLEDQIDEISSKLDKQRIVLLEDIEMFDDLYQQNLEYFNELELYIVAGEEKVVETREDVLPKLREEALASGDPMDAQLVTDFEGTIDRFEKKLHDLKLSKTMSIQTAPQIKLIQNNDKILVDKIQTAILNTIPLWKSQIVITLGLQRQESALDMQRAVTDTTNELLKKNSELIKQNTIETAKESERGIIDISTLQKVNQDLITTITETQKIHEEGRQHRKQVEVELVNLENQLRDTLLKNYQRGN